jgi:hypothetical protein
LAACDPSQARPCQPSSLSRPAPLPGGARSGLCPGRVGARLSSQCYFFFFGGEGGSGNKHNDRKEDLSLEAMEISRLGWASTQTSGLIEGVIKIASVAFALFLLQVLLFNQMHPPSSSLSPFSLCFALTCSRVQMWVRLEHCPLFCKRELRFFANVTFAADNGLIRQPGLPVRLGPGIPGTKGEVDVQMRARR